MREGRFVSIGRVPTAKGGVGTRIYIININAYQLNSAEAVSLANIR